MNSFNKLVLIPLVALAIGGGVGIAAATNGSAGDPATPPATDVKGPCDELEHATDPQCSDAILVPEKMQGTTTGQAEPGDDNGQDQNDPAEAEDSSDDHGQVSDDQGENDDDQGQNQDDQGENEQGDDSSGPSANSGSGSSHSGSDANSSDEGGQSGHGGGDD